MRSGMVWVSYEKTKVPDDTPIVKYLLTGVSAPDTVPLSQVSHDFLQLLAVAH